MKLRTITAIILPVAILASAFAACRSISTDETDGSDRITVTENTVTVSPDDSDTDGYTETETETETEIETETETETDAPPKVLSKTPPADVVTAISPETVHLDATAECKMVILHDVTKDEVLSAFTDEDFTVSKVDNIENAKFETIVLTKAQYVVTVYAYQKGEIRIMWEDEAYNSQDYLTKNSLTGTGGGTVTNIGVDRSNCPDNPMIGMCIVTRLSDGSAIVFDGGVKSDNCAANLFNTLRSLEIAKDENGRYKIAMWIFSHSHSDHVGTAIKFASVYSGRTTVDAFMYNIPSDTSLMPGAGGIANLEKAIATYYPNAKRINPHGGLKYYVGNATIHMLYTPDMIYRHGYTVPYSNNMSIIFMIELGGAKLLLFGDSGNASAEVMWNSYNALAFRCDVLQISHHGLYMSETESGNGHEWTFARLVYTATMAKYAILPTHTQNAAEARNGRYTVFIRYADNGYQISHVMNEKDNHGLQSVSQEYFEAFVKSVAEGTNEYETLYGYDGVNKIVNENGLITYTGSSDTEDMATTFKFYRNEVTVMCNSLLSEWLQSSIFM